MPRNAHLLWAVLPILPFALGLALLELLFGLNLAPPPEAAAEITGATEATMAASASPVFLPASAPSPDAALRFFNAYIRYLTVCFVHMAICAAGLVYVIAKLRGLPPAARQRALTVIALLCLLLVAVNGAARLPAEPGALTLTYRNICEVVRGADVFLHLMPGTCRDPGISPFAYSALLPYLMGLLTAMVAAGLVATTVVSRPEEGLPRKELLERALQLSALVLVSSTVSLMLFYQLPEAILTQDTDKALAHSYGQGMTLFWGACFTLTLCFGFAPALLWVDRAAPEPDHAALTFSGLRQQLSAILAVLAPLIVGAIGPVFEQLIGAL